MKRSTERIRTTHAGRLPVSPGLENLPVRLYLGEVVDPATITLPPSAIGQTAD